MTQNVALILGYGPTVGVAVAQAFAAKGYKIAIVSRRNRDSESEKDYLQIQSDLSDPSSVELIFSRVISEFGHPSVVLYNASSSTLMNSSTALSEQVAAFQSDNNVNIVSAYVAAQLANKSFAMLPPQSSKTFIYTGNKLPFMIVRPLLFHGVGKAGSAHLLHYLAEEYKDSGYKLDGDPVYADIDGDAHGIFYTQLPDGESKTMLW
ncbi:hypothetical protein M441DRAFT_74667 [Trichoderma asperellum CBS 433.97]|uniref:NAD(P)-binding domain-containing protein n=1 Tax=Trichoderma asperellum (strain ATCC 204424 / CBS 433.97 / NBRC 101777) TaxID=1042311 RepID=A0A2T3YR49_TRIA4|nr:hypothetical protein M441DRAFT_74667 [Trichoderma asperellum CBS 433.97]PTB34994.1 hypothetical protein M441DRAFT_74667 [Trichoderma asperellum CBS 433.97]